MNTRGQSKSIETALLFPQELSSFYSIVVSKAEYWVPVRTARQYNLRSLPLNCRRFARFEHSEASKTSLSQADDLFEIVDLVQKRCSKSGHV